jgi:hypothetical protein
MTRISTDEKQEKEKSVQSVVVKEIKAMKKALVCGAGGFVGGHLVKKLKREG